MFFVQFAIQVSSPPATSTASLPQCHRPTSTANSYWCHHFQKFDRVTDLTNSRSQTISITDCGVHSPHKRHVAHQTYEQRTAIRKIFKHELQPMRQPLQRPILIP